MYILTRLRFCSNFQIFVRIMLAHTVASRLAGHPPNCSLASLGSLGFAGLCFAQTQESDPREKAGRRPDAEFGMLSVLCCTCENALFLSSKIKQLREREPQRQATKLRSSAEASIEAFLKLRKTVTKRDKLVCRPFSTCQVVCTKIPDVS